MLLQCKCKTLWCLQYPQCNVSNECYSPGSFLSSQRRLHATFFPQDFNLNLKIPQQVLLHSDREGDLKCHSFSQSFLVTEDEWLEHGSSPDNTASAFRAAKANRYTVTYLASDSFQPQISKGKNGFFIRFQHSIEFIYLNGWVKSSGLKEIVPARHNVLTCDSYACSPRSSFNKYSGQRHPGLMNLHR